MNIYIQVNATQDIPYAEPPLGELRFRPPVPYNASWDCVRDGTQRSEDKTCPQVGLFNDTLRSNEDCLYLDVFVPDSSEDRGPLPVIVWLHGGGYIAGAGTSDNYHPLFYMSHQVIVVEVRSVNGKKKVHSILMVKFWQISPGSVGLPLPWH